MATPTPKSAARRQPPAASQLPEVVDPFWLVKALGIMLVAAMVCAYLALCLLVHQGGWQLMLHPVAKVDQFPVVPWQPVRFDSAAAGTPRLSAWWVPAGDNNPTTPTLLLLHGGDGNLSQSAAQIDLLHNLNVNVFAMDYGGYGQSNPPHPTNARMLADSEAALNYLTATRHLPEARIIPFGTGVGAALAADLAQNHPDLPAIILQNPDPDAPDRVGRNSKSGLLPMRWLVQESFDVRTPLAAARQPRLIILGGLPAPTAEETATAPAFLREAAGPKLTVTLPAGTAQGPQYTEAIRRFLDEYLPAPRP